MSAILYHKTPAHDSISKAIVDLAKELDSVEDLLDEIQDLPSVKEIKLQDTYKLDGYVCIWIRRSAENWNAEHPEDKILFNILRQTKKHLQKMRNRKEVSPQYQIVVGTSESTFVAEIFIKGK